MILFLNIIMHLKRLTKCSPWHICVSCKKLCYKRNVFQISKLQVQRDIPIWRDLMVYVEQQNINPQYICHCKGKFCNSFMSAYCILNNLFVNDVSEVIVS